MCSHYQAVRERERFYKQFGVYPPEEAGRVELWPGYSGLMLRLAPGAGKAEGIEALTGVFGLLPHWARDRKLARSTYNARSETVHEKPSFRDAWRKRQHCVVPADAFFEPDWRSGKAVPTRIARADGEPMGLAGLWSQWKEPAGSLVCSYTLLTINADAHPLLRCFHRPGEERRMVVVLPQGAYLDWLQASAQQRMAFLQPLPAELLQAGVNDRVARHGA